MPSCPAACGGRASHDFRQSIVARVRVEMAEGGASRATAVWNLPVPGFARSAAMGRDGRSDRCGICFSLMANAVFSLSCLKDYRSSRIREFPGLATIYPSFATSLHKSVQHSKRAVVPAFNVRSHVTSRRRLEFRHLAAVERGKCLPIRNEQSA